MEHIDIPLGERHAPHNWEFANAVARVAAVISDAAMIHQLALQLDDGSYWRLAGTSPTSWQQVGVGDGVGTPGSDGKSAYEVALDNGFVGTPEEWLASLDGADGADGADGKSAFQIAQDNGFEGTEQEWLDSLHTSLGYVPENAANKGEAGGYAPLDETSKVPAAYLPGYVDAAQEYSSYAALPVAGASNIIYVTTDDNKTYRWSGTTYVEISPSPGSTDAVPEGATNKYFSAARVLSTVLAGFSAASSAAVEMSDTILVALGKLQGQISNLATALAGKISAGSVNTFTAAQRGGVVELTDADPIVPDFDLANNFSLTLGGNRTLANPTNQVAGQSGSIRIVQDAAGSRMLAFGTTWKFAGGEVPALSTSAGAVDLLVYYVESNTRITAHLVKDSK